MGSTQPNADNVDRSRIDRLFASSSLGSDPRLLGGKCVECGDIQFPKRDRCIQCFSPTENHPLSRIGTLYTFTTIGMGPTGFDSPYTIGYVDLPEEIRIFTTIPENNKLEIGLDMEVIIGTVCMRGGVEVKGYQFIPAEVDP